ncbi:hypothetical protein YC2023_033645 [Brassica napus]
MLKPLVFGDYPDAMKRVLGPRLPVFSEGESEQVKEDKTSLQTWEPRRSVLTNGIEVKLQRNALSVIEAPTGNEDQEDDIEVDHTQWNNPLIWVTSDDTLKPHKAKQRGYRSARLSQKTMCKALSCDSHSKSQSIITPRANMVMPVYCGGDDGGPLKLVLTTPICHNSSSSLCRAWDFKLCRSLFKLIKTM